MRKLETALTTLVMVLAAAPAFAVDTAKVYSSGILVLVFLGIHELDSLEKDVMNPVDQLRWEGVGTACRTYPATLAYEQRE